MLAPFPRCRAIIAYLEGPLPAPFVMARLASMLVALAIGAAALPGHARASDPKPTTPGSMAGTMARLWAANVLPTARLGAEPPGRCRRVDDRRTACPIAIVILARDASGRRPWRCSAMVMIARAGGHLSARRSGTHCTPFPPPAAVPEPAAALGAAAALHANGDIACLPAGAGRVTCVMRYAARCIGAASIPLGRPARAVALGEPVCQARVP
jgi:hypothetical protein